MKLGVLDTDILSLYQRANAAVSRRVSEHRPEELAVTIITVEEQLSSWYTMRRRTKSRDKVAQIYERFTENARFLSRLQILSFTIEAIEEFERLKGLKLGVKANDLRISAIAIKHSATVVTRNRADFARVPGLEIEDWAI